MKTIQAMSQISPSGRIEGSCFLHLHFDTASSFGRARPLSQVQAAAVATCAFADERGALQSEKPD